MLEIDKFQPKQGLLSRWSKQGVKICRLALFFARRQWQTASIHSSRSNKWSLSFTQLANDTEWYAVIHCKREKETKMAQGLLFNMLIEWVSLLLALYTWPNYCLDFSCILSDSSWMWRMRSPILWELHFNHTKTINRLCWCVWCKVQGTNQSILWYVQYRQYTTLKAL